jgi:ribosomal protein L11 methyltransferase
MMSPETELVIYEFRTGAAESLALLERGKPESYLGAELAGKLLGLHLESDFAFLFFGQKVDLGEFLARFPNLELRQVHELRYDQWQDGAGSPPFSIGPLHIKPVFGQNGTTSGPDRTDPPRPLGAPAPLIIDPGLAFGFGGHPTTRACLEFLLRLYRPGTLSSPSPETALDLGCGTGILALAAARLGAKEVMALDHSHLAADAALKNVALNGLERTVTVKRALAQDYAGWQARLVMANIPLFVLRDLVDLGAFKRREHLIVSGLLPEEGDVFLSLLGQVIEHKVLDSKRSDRWISYLLEPSPGAVDLG